jgi:signal transduction histidine kinase/ActR/RegA family two-component response regulator
MIILVVLIAVWMASAFTGSITRLINGISRFRAGGRHCRFNAKVKDELGTLADSFDEMADGLVDSITELEDAVLEANKANASKGEFLARMSHEIRTPMNAIIGMNNIVKKRLGEKTVDVEDTQSYVNQIDTSSQHLLGLLNDILDISKIDSGKIELAEETVDLSKLSDTVVSIIQPRCDEKKISFHATFDVPLPASFLTDSLRLRQVLINLLGNAVKFTPEHGKIELSIAQKEKEDDKALVEFSVRDSGIGMSESTLAVLFQPFEQGNRQISRRYGGTGLGLAISRRIVQLLGGDISVESKEGEGSFFSFAIRMPLVVPEVEPELPAIADINDISNLFTGKRALLVDDVMVNRLIAADLLSSTGMDIDEADDGTVAVKMFEESAENTYDIIYMDVQMPTMDGYEATSTIRAMDRPDAKTVPIVALTANAFKDDVEKALKHGMNTHLAKPIEMDKLLETSIKYLLN